MLRKLALNFLWYGGLGGIIPLTHYQIGHFIYYKIKIPVLRQILWAINRFVEYGFIRVFLTCEIPAQCHIGKRLHLPHGAKGIVINKMSFIGDNVLIYHQVTLGTRGVSKQRKAPNIGNGVIIGAGAKIIGGITIGDNVRIGANAVVINDVPPNSTVVGVPARIVD